MNLNWLKNSLTRAVWLSMTLILALVIGLQVEAENNVSQGGEICVVKPVRTSRALRNPLKGFTTRGVRADHTWATLAQGSCSVLRP